MMVFNFGNGAMYEAGKCSQRPRAKIGNSTLEKSTD